MELPRQPGARETRWTHLLSGAPAVEAVGTSYPADVPVTDVTVSEIAALKAKLAALEADVAGLKVLVAKLCTELGYQDAD
jgi:uncharacterized protein YceH (UPF0502 family)